MIYYNKKKKNNLIILMRYFFIGIGSTGNVYGGAGAIEVGNIRRTVH